MLIKEFGSKPKKIVANERALNDKICDLFKVIRSTGVSGLSIAATHIAVSYTHLTLPTTPYV